MKTHARSFYKYTFFFFLCLTLYFIFVMLILPFFADPRLQRFEQYSRLYNWELRQHAQGDFDGDGQKDLISFTGCAFFSAADVNQIPVAERCTARGVTALVFSGQDDRIGQKYLESSVFDLGLAAFEQTGKVTHSYVGKKANENWKLYVSTDSKHEVFDIAQNGILQKTQVVLFETQADALLYSLSRWSFLLSLPLVFVQLIFSPLLQSGSLHYTTAFLIESGILLLLALVFFYLWKKSSK